MNTSALGPVNPALCPLCGQPNHCAMAEAAANDQPCASPCWCEGATFPPSLLNRVPDVAKRRACICARCVSADSIPFANNDNKDLP